MERRERGQDQRRTKAVTPKTPYSQPENATSQMPTLNSNNHRLQPNTPYPQPEQVRPPNGNHIARPTTPHSQPDHARPQIPPQNGNNHRTRPTTSYPQLDHPPLPQMPTQHGEHITRPTQNGDHLTRPLPSISGVNRPHYYPTSSPPHSSSASIKGCCCCLFLLFSFLALLILAVVLVVVLAVKPKKPQFDLQQVGVQYMGISPSPIATTADTTTIDTSAAASLSLDIRLLFSAVNPNKVGIKYGESKFTVMYRGIPLGKASVPPFFQEAHSVRQVSANIAVDRVNLLQADAADIVRDASLNDKVELRVLGDVGAKIRFLDFDSPGVQVSVDCAIVISPMKQSLTYKQCGFDGLSV